MHPLLHTILDSLVGELALHKSTETLFSGSNGFLLSVTVDPFYLDPDVDHLMAEIINVGLALRALAPRLPVELDLAALADDILALDDISVGVHARGVGEHFEAITTEPQWYDMLDNHIWRLMADEYSSMDDI